MPTALFAGWLGRVGVVRSLAWIKPYWQLKCQYTRSAAACKVCRAREGAGSDWPRATSAIFARSKSEFPHHPCRGPEFKSFPMEDEKTFAAKVSRRTLITGAASLAGVSAIAPQMARGDEREAWDLTTDVLVVGVAPPEPAPPLLPARPARR